MSEKIYLITVAVMFGTPLLIFGMKYISAIYQAKARAAASDADAAALSALRGDLAEIKTRLAAVEKILKDVE